MSYSEIVVPGGAFGSTVGMREIPDVESGLILDYDPDVLVGTVANGSAITSLPSKGSNKLALDTQVSTYTKPVLTHGAVNGHAALTFNGANSLRTATSPVILSEGEPSVFAVVFRITALTDSRLISASEVGASPYNYRGIDLGVSGSFRVQNNIAGVAVNTPSKAISLDTWVVAIAHFQGTALKSVNSLDTIERSATMAAPARHLGLTIGINSSASLRMNGQVARVLCFNRALSGTDTNALLDILCTRYGITRALD